MHAIDKTCFMIAVSGLALFSYICLQARIRLQHEEEHKRKLREEHEKAQVHCIQMYEFLPVS